MSVLQSLFFVSFAGNQYGISDLSGYSSGRMRADLRTGCGIKTKTHSHNISVSLKEIKIPEFPLHLGFGVECG